MFTKQMAKDLVRKLAGDRPLDVSTNNIEIDKNRYFKGPKFIGVLSSFGDEWVLDIELNNKEHPWLDGGAIQYIRHKTEDFFKRFNPKYEKYVYMTVADAAQPGEPPKFRVLLVFNNIKFLGMFWRKQLKDLILSL